MNESEIRTLVESQYAAIHAKDLDRLMSHYSPDVVYFDVVPPLQYVGSAALRDRFRHWFDGYRSGIGAEVHDLTIVAGGEVAFLSALVRTSGTLQNGTELDAWARATSCFKRSDGSWLITHEHISVPVDPISRSAALDLAL
jgi:uncharacterized protein (TIGR02246 family)